jgi:hypothetical protein
MSIQQNGSTALATNAIHRLEESSVRFTPSRTENDSSEENDHTDETTLPSNHTTPLPPSTVGYMKVDDPTMRNEGILYPVVYPI